MGLTCWSRMWAPLCCIPYQRRDQRRMLLSLSCLSYQLIEFSPFGVPDTLIPGSSESAARPQTSNNARGCSFIIPWEGRPESQHWLAKSLAHRLGFFGREEVTICLQAPASWPSPKEELLYPSLEDSGVSMLASSWLLPETSRMLYCSFPGSERKGRRGNQAIIVGPQRNKISPSASPQLV